MKEIALGFALTMLCTVMAICVIVMAVGFYKMFKG